MEAAEGHRLEVAGDQFMEVAGTADTEDTVDLVVESSQSRQSLAAVIKAGVRFTATTTAVVMVTGTACMEAGTVMGRAITEQLV